jgi:hypothetical protein
VNIGYVVIIVVLLAMVALGLRASTTELWRNRSALTQPLGSVVSLYGRFLILYLAAAGWTAADGFTGGGPRGSVCVDTGYPAGGSARLGAWWSARPGASLGVTSNVLACALHPSLGQWALYLLTKLPGIAFWGCLILLIWRLIRAAGRSGPFTPQAAVTMRHLGWVVIVGSMVVAALGHLGSDVLTRMLMAPSTYNAGSTAVNALVVGPVTALLPVPLLAGAALLTFARITRLGAVMDDEIRATV